MQQTTPKAILTYGCAHLTKFKVNLEFYMNFGDNEIGCMHLCQRILQAILEMAKLVIDWTTSLLIYVLVARTLCYL